MQTHRIKAGKIKTKINLISHLRTLTVKIPSDEQSESQDVPYARLKKGAKQPFQTAYAPNR